jgi:hypothetical protein
MYLVDMFNPNHCMKKKKLLIETFCIVFLFAGLFYITIFKGTDRSQQKCFSII